MPINMETVWDALVDEIKAEWLDATDVYRTPSIISIIEFIQTAVVTTPFVLLHVVEREEVTTTMDRLSINVFVDVYYVQDTDASEKIADVVEAKVVALAERLYGKNLSSVCHFMIQPTYDADTENPLNIILRESTLNLYAGRCSLTMLVS